MTDLRDVTLLIPLRIDCNGRFQNIKILLPFLYKYLDTHVMILEVDRQPNPDLPAIISKFPAIQYLFLRNDDALFYRTAYLNAMIDRATTPIVSLYDSDMLCHPDQLLKAVDYIRSHQTIIASPFETYTIYRVDGFFKERFVKEDMNLVLLTPPPGAQLWGANGGIVFVDRVIYRQTCGGENEEFRSWGDEDTERIVRTGKFGYAFKRVPGGAVHMEHMGTYNAYTPADQARHKANYNEGRKVLERMTNMTQDQVRQHIRRHPWRSVQLP